MKTNVLDYLEDTTAEYPDKIAFSTVKESISYKTLMDSARMLGSCLASITQPRAPVAVYMDKSCDAIISFMGAVYAGCFYSFIDQRQPLTRLNTIINTLQPSVLIVTDKTLANAQTLSLDCKIINISKMEKDIIDDELLMSIRSQHVDVDPLYCNFTSGSTGTPKGVAICHRSVIDFIEAFTDIFKITSDDVIGNQAPLDFDVSVKDIYSGLKTGAEVVLIPRSYFTFLAKLMKLLDEKQITTLIWAVSALCIISTMDGLNFLLPKSINKVMFSGEVMPNNHLSYWRKYYPNAMFVNLYGPTEITCNCTYHIVDREYGQMESMPIGIPFPNERVFLLDEKNSLVTQPNKDGEL